MSRIDNPAYDDLPHGKQCECFGCETQREFGSKYCHRHQLLEDRGESDG